MDRDVVQVQERQGDTHVSYTFELTYEEFYSEIKNRAVPGCTMICGTFAYGDAFMLTPALRGLKELLPDNPVHLYCCPREYDIFTNNPRVDLLVSVPKTFLGPAIRIGFSRLCQVYDRSYLLKGCINGNPEAEVINAYELLANIVGVRPRSWVPEYYLLPVERERARQALESVGIAPGQDKIAAIQPASSALLRTLPDSTIETLLQRLQCEGWKSIVFWKDKNLPDKASRLGYWTSRDFSSLHIRDLCALVSFSSIVIATDSMLSHLSAALDIPAVLLYGPFASEVRAKHFPRAYPLQADVECGPCFQHGSRCTVEGKGIPSCMRWFSTEAIVEAMDAVLRPNYTRRAQKVLDVQQQQKSMTCRTCDGTEFSYYARKKDVIYHRCIKCGTAQICAPLGGHDLFTTPQHHYFARQGRKGRKPAELALYTLLPTVHMLVHNNCHRPLLLDFGAGAGRTSRILEQMDCEVEVFESDAFLAERLSAQGVTHWADLEQLVLARKNKYDVIAMLHSFPYLSAVRMVFSEVMRCLKTDGWLVLTLFSTADIDNPSISPVLGTRAPGETPLIPSFAGLDAFMAGFSLKRVWDSRIPTQRGHLFVYKELDKSCA